MNSYNYKIMDMTFRRTLPASPAEVYDAWLSTETPGNPWHGADKAIFEPKPGALFYFLRSKDGTETAHYGRFALLQRPHKAQLTWMSPYTRGLESVVTVTFEAKGEDTVLTLNHANLPDDDFGRLHELGWGMCLAPFTDHFIAKRA